MKNSLIFFFSYLFINFLILNPANSEDQFIFNVTELKITENGDKIKGLKNGTATTKDGLIIEAEEFDYNKSTNILIATGNVKLFDTVKKTEIFSDKAIYFKDKERVITIGQSKVIDGKTIITADNFEYDKNQNIFNANGNVKIFDTIKKTEIFSDKAIYFKDKERVITIGQSKAIDNGIIITADNFEHDRYQNIFNANGNVKIDDTNKDYLLFSEDITYLKNEEKILSKGKTTVEIEKKYDFLSKDVQLLRNILELSSSEKSFVKDDNLNEYELDEFTYYGNERLLKGKNVIIKTSTKIDNLNTNTDKYFFSEGFFNFKDQSFISKKTKINVHKNIFDNTENDPRLFGVSSIGNDKKTVINKGVFTSCKLIDDCPAPWSIKANKITHDKIKKEMIYDHAILRLYDYPILYFPKFFHPDPTVKRRTGFLHPQFNNSTNLGQSIYMPYFKVISDSSDFTFKPTLFENDKYIIQNEFRRETKLSSLITDFSLTKGYRSTHDNRRNSIGHLFLRYNYDLNLDNFEDSVFNLNIEKVTHDTYLKVFSNNLFESPAMPKNKNILTSGLNLDLDHEDYNFSASMSIYENLQLRNSDRYQFILPSYDFSKSILPEKFNGTFSFYSNGSNNLSNTNNLRTSVINDLNYNSLDYFSNFGSKSNFGLYFKNLNSTGKNDPVYKSSANIDAMNLIEIGTSLPLSKTNNKTYEVLTPKLSLRVNPFNNMKNSSSSSNSISADNVFNIDRLGLSDTFEAGKSLTIGLDYRLELSEKILDIQSDNFFNKDFNEQVSKSIEFRLASVFRDKEENFISPTSTINRTTSNLFGAMVFNLSENLSFNYNFSLDNDLTSLNSNTIDTTLSMNNFVTKFNFSEKNDELGSSNTISNETEIKLNNSNYIRFKTRRNREINLTEYYNLSYEYKTDCITAALKYDKIYYKDRDLRPSENLFFTITLIPLTTYEKKLFAR